MENGDLYVGDPSNMPEGTVIMGDGDGDAPAGGPGGGSPAAREVSDAGKIHNSSRKISRRP